MFMYESRKLCVHIATALITCATTCLLHNASLSGGIALHNALFSRQIIFLGTVNAMRMLALGHHAAFEKSGGCFFCLCMAFGLALHTLFDHSMTLTKQRC